MSDILWWIPISISLFVIILAIGLLVFPEECAKLGKTKKRKFENFKINKHAKWIFRIEVDSESDCLDYLESITCSKCHYKGYPDYCICPHCGAKIRDKTCILNGQQIDPFTYLKIKTDINKFNLFFRERYDEMTDVITDGLKHDGGIPRLSLVPPILIRAVGTVMTHGAEKYGVNSYKNVEPDRYRDALARHYCEYMEDPYGVDKDSGLPHLWHVACNVAFLLELDKKGD